MRFKSLIFVIPLFTSIMVSCKFQDPRDRTVWDYIGTELASESQFQSGVEAFHRDLIRHGYMQDHDCKKMDCAQLYQNAYGDIIRINEALSGDSSTEENSSLMAVDSSFEKMYANKYFSLSFPSDWQVVEDDGEVTDKTTVSVQIMAKQKNDTSLRPNINIIVFKDKHTESLDSVIQQAIVSNRSSVPDYNQINVILAKVGERSCKRLEFTTTVNAYVLRCFQYVVQKQDGTIVLLTATTDNSCYLEQLPIIEAIISKTFIY